MEQVRAQRAFLDAVDQQRVAQEQITISTNQLEQSRHMKQDAQQIGASALSEIPKL